MSLKRRLFRKGTIQVKQLAIIGLRFLPTASMAGQLTDEEVRESIVQESIAAYHATGRPCARPYDVARNNSSCGDRSAYSRPRGAAPLCYPKDGTGAMVRDWRAHH